MYKKDPPLFPIEQLFAYIKLFLDYSDHAQPIPLLSDYYAETSKCNQLRVLRGI